MLFALLLSGCSVLVTIALLTMFFLREWALVLFLWKAFQLLGFLLLLLSYAPTRLAPPPHLPIRARSIRRALTPRSLPPPRFPRLSSP